MKLEQTRESLACACYKEETAFLKMNAEQKREQKVAKEKGIHYSGLIYP